MRSLPSRHDLAGGDALVIRVHGNGRCEWMQRLGEARGASARLVCHAAHRFPIDDFCRAASVDELATPPERERDGRLPPGIEG